MGEEWRSPWEEGPGHPSLGSPMPETIQEFQKEVFHPFTQLLAHLLETSSQPG